MLVFKFTLYKTTDFKADDDINSADDTCHCVDEIQRILDGSYATNKQENIGLSRLRR